MCVDVCEREEENGWGGGGERILSILPSLQSWCYTSIWLSSKATWVAHPKYLTSWCTSAVLHTHTLCRKINVSFVTTYADLWRPRRGGSGAVVYTGREFMCVCFGKGGGSFGFFSGEFFFGWTGRARSWSPPLDALWSPPLHPQPLPADADEDGLRWNVRVWAAACHGGGLQTRVCATVLFSNLGRSNLRSRSWLKEKRQSRAFDHQWYALWRYWYLWSASLQRDVPQKMKRFKGGGQKY